MIHSKANTEIICLRWGLKNNLLVLIVLLLPLNFLLAQNLKVNLSPRHIARVENTKSAVVKLKKY